jgi:hypothetical protein
MHRTLVENSGVVVFNHGYNELNRTEWERGGDGFWVGKVAGLTNRQ